MTRSTHSKSRKPRNQKQISQKRGSRKLQRGGWSLNDFLPSFLKSNKVDSSFADSQSKANEVKNSLKNLLTAVEGMELCEKRVQANTAEADAQRQEQERLKEDERRKLEEEERRKREEEERLRQAEPMGGGMGSRSNSRSNRRSNRRGRGRAPPKKGKKGMVVGPVGQRKGGPIIF
jgi:hypothetical protein